MALTEKRRNEIAYLIVLGKTKKHGIPNLQKNELQRSLVNEAKQLGVTIEEAQEFMRGLILPLVEAAFPAPKADDGHNFSDGVEG